MPFLSEPRPEKICEIAHIGGDKVEYGQVLTVGLTLTTHTHSGIKIVPTKEIRVAIGKNPDDAESSAQNIPVSMARDLAERIIEMCDAADEGKTQ